MLTKSILTATAIALVAGLGSASAGEQFITTEGIEAQVMTPLEMGGIYGTQIIFLSVNALANNTAIVLAPVPQCCLEQVTYNESASDGILNTFSPPKSPSLSTVIKWFFD